MSPSSNTGAGGSPTVTARLLRILFSFDPQSPVLTLAELQLRTGFSYSTLHRLVNELVEWGGLERDGQHAYRIGVRIFELGMMAPEPRQLRELAVPVMEDLYISTGNVVHLGVLDGDGVLLIEKLTGLRSARPPSAPGGRLPAHATALGKALLAFSPAAVVDQVLAGGLPAYTPATIVDAAVLRADLETTRGRGYSIALQERSLGTASVAAPLRGAQGHAVAALSVVGRHGRFDSDRTGTTVTAVAALLSRELRGVSGAAP